MRLLLEAGFQGEEQGPLPSPLDRPLKTTALDSRAVGKTIGLLGISEI